MDSVISALRIVTLTSNSLFFCLRPSLTTNLSLCFLLLLTLHMPILCLLLSTSYPFLHFRFLHFVLLSSSISFFSTFIYILLCLFLVFSILPSFFNHLQVPFASFFLSIFLSLSIFISYLSSFLCFVSTNLYPVYASFLFFFPFHIYFPAFFLPFSKISLLSILLSLIHFVYALSDFPHFSSFTPYIFHSSSLQSTTAANNQVYKSNKKHLTEYTKVQCCS